MTIYLYRFNKNQCEVKPTNLNHKPSSSYILNRKCNLSLLILAISSSLSDCFISFPSDSQNSCKEMELLLSLSQILNIFFVKYSWWGDGIYHLRTTCVPCAYHVLTTCGLRAYTNVYKLKLKFCIKSLAVGLPHI